MKFIPLFALGLLAVGLCETHAAEPATVTTNAPPALASGLVAKVNQVDIPYDWYLHEFRSTFYRHAGAPDVRQEVMDGMVDRMLLYDAALTSGVTNDPVAQAGIERQLKSMEEFMHFQLVMARIGLTIEAYLEKNPPVGLKDADEDELRAFYLQEIAGQPGAPATYDDLSPSDQEQVRQQVEGQRQQTVLRKLVDGMRSNATIQVNLPLMKSTPMPAMKGDVPEEFMGEP